MVNGTAYRMLSLFWGEDTLGFVEICKRAGYETDLGRYYLLQLVSRGFVERINRGKYSITTKGKRELTLRYHTYDQTFRPRFIILLIARQQNKFVVVQRQKQPFLETVEWPTYPVYEGDLLAVAARKALSERLGVAGEPSFLGFFRRIDLITVEPPEVFDDKLFAVHSIELSETSSVNAETETGLVRLVTRSALHALPNLSPALFDILAYAESATTKLEERAYEFDTAT